MFDGLKSLWDEPSEGVGTLCQQQTGEHCYDYIIPAGERLTPDGTVEEAILCHICFEMDPGSPFVFDGPDPQEEEAATQAQYHKLRESFFRDGGPGDRILNIVPGRPTADPQSRRFPADRRQGRDAARP